jgi:hypothetical protein
MGIEIKWVKVHLRSKGGGEKMKLLTFRFVSLWIGSLLSKVSL